MCYNLEHVENLINNKSPLIFLDKNKFPRQGRDFWIPWDFLNVENVTTKFVQENILFTLKKVKI